VFDFWNFEKEMPECAAKTRKKEKTRKNTKQKIAPIKASFITPHRDTERVTQITRSVAVSGVEQQWSNISTPMQCLKGRKLG
jgi:hypothetical protein